jgi:RNA polymerase sigma-70 factor (ECF subfamily)
MPPPDDDTEESDEALIRSCLERAPGAFERLVERHRRVVYHAVRTALERTGAREDAELADEAFVRVFSALAEGDMKALRSFRGQSRLGTFLVVVARRTALRLFAERRPRSGRLPPQPLDGPGGHEPFDPAPDPSARAEHEEERALVRASVAELPPRDALALRLFYDQDLSHREIGRILGVPVTHVGQILARAREKLRKRLDRAGFGSERADGA